MQARYYSSAQGRFTGVDPLLASGIPANPKSWNRYAYALNNPLRFIDPSGLNAQDTQQQAPDCNGTGRVPCHPTGDGGTFGSLENAYDEVTVAASSVVGFIGTARRVTNEILLGPIGADVSDLVANGMSTAIRESNKLMYGEGPGTVYNNVIEHPVTQLGFMVGGGLAGIRAGAARGAAAASGSGLEVFYRAMPRTHALRLAFTGEMPAGSETFISPTRAFASGYKGTLIEFRLNAGTTQRLAEIGVRDGAARTADAYPNMPRVSSGWGSNNAFFKTERGQINIGLGNGNALNVFNRNIRGWNVLRF